MNVTFSQGKINIDAQWLFEQLEDEQRAELARLVAYHSDQYKELEQYVASGYASTHFNPLVHKLRIAFLTSEDAPELTKYLITSLINEKQKMQEDAERWRSKYTSLYEVARRSGIVQEV